MRPSSMPCAKLSRVWWKVRTRLLKVGESTSYIQQARRRQLGHFDAVRQAALTHLLREAADEAFAQFRRDHLARG